MAVNWLWSNKKGEIVWKKKKDSKNDKAPNKKFKWSIYHANCLCCMLYEFKEDKTDKYQFMTWFGDIHHAKRMLGLEKCSDGTKTNLFNDWYLDYEIDYITLDTSYPYWDKLCKLFTEAGYNVRLYKGDK